MWITLSPPDAGGDFCWKYAEKRETAENLGFVPWFAPSVSCTDSFLREEG
jgi:hypothetical protein